MAFYIDEAGKRGLKAEGKLFFAWDKETRKFSVSVDDAPPKSRMKRCSEYEAKFFNFKSDPADWPTEINRLCNLFLERDQRISDEGELTVEEAIKRKEESDLFVADQKPSVKSAVQATREYGVEGGDVGKIAQNLMTLLVSDQDLAINSIEMAKCKAEIKKCAECPFAQTGDGPKLCERCEETGAECRIHRDE